MPDSRNSEATPDSSEALLRRVLRATSTGVFVWNVIGGSMLVSKHLHGSGAAIDDTYEEWLQLIHPEDTARVVAEIEKSIKAKTCFRLEFRAIHPDGELRWISCQGEILCDPHGIPVRVIGTTTDITRYRHLQEEWKRSEEQFRTLANTIPQLAWMAASDGFIFWYNQRWYEYTGTTYEEMKGWGWQKVHDPAELPRVLEKFKAHISSGEAWEDTFPLRRRDGTYRWFLSRAIPICDSSGAVVRWFGTNTDITERLQMEDDLRRGQERLTLALEAAHAATWDVDLVSGETHWSASHFTLLGYKAEECLPSQQAWFERIHPEDRERVLQEWESAKAKKAEYLSQYRVLWPDGSVHWIESHGKFLLDEYSQPYRCVGAIVDVTERKQAEDAAQTQQSKLAAIVESSDDAIVAKDLTGVISAWNRGAERIFGYTAAEAIGKPITLIIPKELHHEETMILSKIARGERIDHFETTRVTKAGERVQVSVTVSPMRNSSGRIVGASKVARDITERKKVETALRTSEKLAAAGRLAATIAHEINNPLEAVVNLLYLARNGSRLPTEVATYLELADQELSRIFHITRQTLGFYREGNAPQSTRVSELISNLLVLYGGRIRNRDIGVELHVRNETEIIAIAGELRQVFANLLSNSIDAVNAGSGRIHVHVSSVHRPRGVRITIGDNGTGISPDNQARIFEPFFTTKKDIGTGLGLWISKEIIEKHNGSIRVRSCALNGHAGTVFSVFLPIEGLALPTEHLTDAGKRTSVVA